jgi:Flp pilus assembly protein TadG
MIRPNSLRALARADSGQAIVEMAIVAPLMILLAVVAIDVGRYLFQGIEVGNAARAAVQYGAQNATTATNAAGMTSAAQADARDIGPLAVTSSTYCTCDSIPGTAYDGCLKMPACPAGDHVDLYVKAMTSETFTPVVAYPGIPNPITITRTATQQVTPP